MDGVLFYPTLLAVVKAIVLLSLCSEFFSFMPQKKPKKSSRISTFMSFFGGQKNKILDSPN